MCVMTRKNRYDISIGKNNDDWSNKVNEKLSFKDDMLYEQRNYLPDWTSYYTDFNGYRYAFDDKYHHHEIIRWPSYSKKNRK